MPARPKTGWACWRCGGGPGQPDEALHGAAPVSETAFVDAMIAAQDMCLRRQAMRHLPVRCSVLHSQPVSPHCDTASGAQLGAAPSACRASMCCIRQRPAHRHKLVGIFLPGLQACTALSKGLGTGVSSRGCAGADSAEEGCPGSLRLLRGRTGCCQVQQPPAGRHRRHHLPVSDPTHVDHLLPPARLASDGWQRLQGWDASSPDCGRVAKVRRLCVAEGGGRLVSPPAGESPQQARPEGWQADAGLHVGVQVVDACGPVQVVRLPCGCMARAGGIARAAQLLQCRSGTAPDSSHAFVRQQMLLGLSHAFVWQQTLLGPAVCTEA